MCPYWPFVGPFGPRRCQPRDAAAISGPVVDDTLDSKLRNLVMEPLPLPLGVREDRPPRHPGVRY